MRVVHDEVCVRVPATSANLGPGFDSLGLALALYDDVRARAVTGATFVEVTGQGSGKVPIDDTHLVARAVRFGLEYVGASQVGLHLRCHNRIPHGRGLGSSAAAVVAGLLIARGLIADPAALSSDIILALATQFEGHPDNAAPAIYGGARLCWVQGERPQSAPVACDGRIRAVIYVPSHELATVLARASLPGQVPFADAAFNLTRTGLLILALGGRSEYFFDATEDRLHQQYRAPVMPATAEVLSALRAQGLAAAVSGAGPSIIVLGDEDGVGKCPEVEGWLRRDIGLDTRGGHLLGGA